MKKRYEYVDNGVTGFIKDNEEGDSVFIALASTPNGRIFLKEAMYWMNVREEIIGQISIDELESIIN